MQLYYGLVLLFETTVKKTNLVKTHYMGMGFKTAFVSTSDVFMKNKTHAQNMHDKEQQRLQDQAAYAKKHKTATRSIYKKQNEPYAKLKKTSSTKIEGQEKNAIMRMPTMKSVMK